MMLEGMKIYETRDRDSLRTLLGQTVSIIRTGNGPATVVGYARIASKIVISDMEKDGTHAKLLFSQSCIGETSKYRRFKSGKKYFYGLENVTACDPYEPIRKAYHGFSYAEIYGPGEKTVTAETAPEIRKEIAEQIATRKSATICLKQLATMLQTELRNL